MDSSNAAFWAYARLAESRSRQGKSRIHLMSFSPFLRQDKLLEHSRHGFNLDQEAIMQFPGWHHCAGRLVLTEELGVDRVHFAPLRDVGDVHRYLEDVLQVA